MRTRNWTGLAVAACVIALIGTSFYISRLTTDHPLPIYLAECRYAEIESPAIRTAIGNAIAAIHLDGVCATAYDVRGDFYFRQYEWKEAARQYGYGLQISPDDLNLRNDHGMTRIASNAFRDAKDDYTVMLRFDPRDTEAWMRRGNAKEVLGDWQGAIADYDQGLRIDPGNTEALGYRGRAFTLLGRYPEAIADLTRATDSDPDNLSTVLWLYLAQRKNGKDGGAWLRKHTQSLDLKPWPGSAIQYFLGNFSMDTLQSIVDADPHMDVMRQKCDAWFYLGEDALIRGDKDKARQLLMRTISGCDGVDYEWDAAQLELKRLGR